jgi:RluA family pseudouridine synthase
VSAELPPDYEILYEEGPCLVVNKPGGLLTQAPPHIDSLELQLKTLIKQRDDKPGKAYLGVPHRLDRPVSGAIVLALHVRAARSLSEQFQQRTVNKVYWACVEGTLQEDAGSWQDTMRKVPGEARSEIVAADHPDARQAILHFKVIKRHDSWSWLQIQLETGRTHQIRLQCSARGLPIVGDRQYGSQRPFGPVCEDPRRSWIALHARQLVFDHPMTGEQVDITAPVASYWDELEVRGWSPPEAD